MTIYGGEPIAKVGDIIVRKHRRKVLYRVTDVIKIPYTTDVDDPTVYVWYLGHRVNKDGSDPKALWASAWRKGICSDATLRRGVSHYLKEA
jgi:hypothetical protein